MSVPRELIDATKAACDAAGYHPAILVPLTYVPDGWAKVDGEWWRVQPFECEADDGETFTAYIIKDGCA